MYFSHWAHNFATEPKIKLVLNYSFILMSQNELFKKIFSLSCERLFIYKISTFSLGYNSSVV